MTETPNLEQLLELGALIIEYFEEPSDQSFSSTIEFLEGLDLVPDSQDDEAKSNDAFFSPLLRLLYPERFNFATDSGEGINSNIDCASIHDYLQNRFNSDLWCTVDDSKDSIRTSFIDDEHQQVEDYIARLKQGNNTAWTQLQKEIGPELRHYLLKRQKMMALGDISIEDIEHEIWLTAYRTILHSEFDYRLELSEWFKCLAKTKLLDAVQESELKNTNLIGYWQLNDSGDGERDRVITFLSTNTHCQEREEEPDNIPAHLASKRRAKNKYDVFVSYNRTDGIDDMLRLRNGLKDNFNIWIDNEKRKPGNDWRNAIIDAINNTDVMILLLSHDSFTATSYVKQELEYAQNIGTRIIPVTFAADIYATASRWLKIEKPILLVEDNPASWERLCQQITALLQSKHHYSISQSLGKNFIGREKEINILRNGLLDAVFKDRPYNIILQGAGGTGKTTLAAHICQDEYVQETYRDGIVWANIGKNTSNITGEINAILQTLTKHQDVYYDNLHEAMQRLQSEIKDRNCLIVLDDVSDAAQIKPFEDTIAATYLITTRSKIVASKANLIIPIAEMKVLKHLRLLQSRYFKASDISRTTFQDQISDILPNPFEWCEVLGGQVTQSDGKIRLIKPFRIAKYPISYDQYQVFVDADDGYIDPQWWDYSDDARNWRIAHTMSIESEHQGNGHPRTQITWYEAVAFCKWLSAKTDDTIRLPTEAEWQRAAQGDDGRLYPWGDEWDNHRCQNNIARQQIGTINVTTFDGQGDSPYGVVDLTSNVWEWCMTSWLIEDNAPKNNGSQILRGGTWFGSVKRLYGVPVGRSSPPDARSDRIGFRVCTSASAKASL